MKVRNTTDISDILIRDVIRLVRPNGISNFDVMVKRGIHYKAMAYYAGCGYHMTADPFITVHMAPAEDWLSQHVWNGKRMPVRAVKFPMEKRANGAYLRTVLLSRLEYLVYLIAHEVRHLWQSNHTRGKVWGSRGRFSERDADAYAIRMVRLYRRTHT